MKNFEQHITRIPEGTERWTWAPKFLETEEKVVQVLEIQQIKATPRNLDYTEVKTALVEQLREYAETAKVETLVIGVSGGVDSGLVSTLCAETGLKVVCVELPIHQAEDQVNRAQNHIAWLQNKYPNVEVLRVDLTKTFETLKQALPQIENEEVVRYMAYVNTRSRLRGVTLYALANEQNGLVVGTGNKVEDYGIGFFTKFGDGAVDISPIGELLKSEVRELARRLWVNPEVSEAVATDGLHSTGATDEDQIGATYDELEWAMEQYDTGKRAQDFTGRAQEVMKIYTARHEWNTHKMNMPPVFRFPIPGKWPEVGEVYA